MQNSVKRVGLDNRSPADVYVRDFMIEQLI